jgi:hypothetical protein
VFLGAALAMISGFFRERAQSRRASSRHHEDGTSPGPDSRDGAR